MTLPLFPVTSVGSWPRPRPLVRALARRRAGTLSPADFDALADQAVLSALAAQEAAGVDIVTDGEQRRDNFYSFVAEKLDGVRLFTLAEMLDIIDDKESFRRLLDTLDVPAYSISNPTCVGPVRRREPLAAGELRFLRRHTARPVKVALPGPYLLTRAMWVREVASRAYASKEHLARDVVSVLREEIAELVEAGADFIQLDEPVLSELVFAEGRTRTFMCAALAARNDPAEELEFAVSLVNRVLDGLGDQVRTGLHVCRGNWSRDETTLLRGSYAPLASWLARINVGQLVLEYATERAGSFVPVGGKELGFGVVNPRTAAVETSDEIVERVRAVLDHVPPSRVFLNPDCGFGTFSARPVNDPETATRKLAAMAQAARVLRETVPAGEAISGAGRVPA
jgi:5-methyltetrahydropteroyltriglutamate--homocysteine methyltransferase